MKPLPLLLYPSLLLPPRHVGTKADANQIVQYPMCRVASHVRIHRRFAVPLKQQVSSNVCLVPKLLPNICLIQFLQPPWTIVRQRYGLTYSLTPVRMAARLGVLCLSPPNTYGRYPDPSATNRWPSAAPPKYPVSTTSYNAGRRVPSPTFSSQMKDLPVTTAVTRQMHCARLHTMTRPRL